LSDNIEEVPTKHSAL